MSRTTEPAEALAGHPHASSGLAQAVWIPRTAERQGASPNHRIALLLPLVLLLWRAGVRRYTAMGA